MDTADRLDTIERQLALVLIALARIDGRLDGILRRLDRETVG